MYVTPVNIDYARELRRAGAAPRAVVSSRVPATPRQWRRVRARIHRAASTWARAAPAPLLRRPALRLSAHRAADHAVLKQYRFTAPAGSRILRGGGAPASAPPDPSIDENIVKDVFKHFADIVEEQYGVRLEFDSVTPPVAAADGSYESTIAYHPRESPSNVFRSVQPAETTAYFLSANNLLAEMKTSVEKMACGAYFTESTVRVDPVENNPMIRIKCRDGSFAVRDSASQPFRVQGSDPLDEVKADNQHRKEMELQDMTDAWESTSQAGAGTPPVPAAGPPPESSDHVIDEILHQ